MLRYITVSSLAVRLNLWGRKAFHKLPILRKLPISNAVYDPSNTKTETKGEI